MKYEDRVMAALMATLFAAAFFFAWHGCAPVVGVPRAKSHAGEKSFAMTDSQCVELMQSRDRLFFLAKLGAALGGGAGLSTAIPQGDDRDERTARWVLGGLAATSAGIGVAAAFAGDSKARDFERFCEVER